MIWLMLCGFSLVVLGTWFGSVLGARVARTRIRRMLRNLSPTHARKSDPPTLPIELYRAALASRNAAQDAKATAERVVAQLAQH